MENKNENNKQNQSNASLVQNNQPAQNEKTMNQSVERKMALDDDQRVKVLSPSMLVFKRFIRNKLAIIGSFIIVGMFLFAFVGGIVSPYNESQVFMGYEAMSKDYASVTRNKEFRYTTVDGKNFPSAVKAEVILAVNSGKSEFTSMGNVYALTKEGENLYRISLMDKYATATIIRGTADISVVDGKTLSEAVKNGFLAAIEAKETSFTVDGVTYQISNQGKEYSLGVLDDVALASHKILDAYNAATKLSLEFKLQAEKAFIEGKNSFEVEGVTYYIDSEGSSATIYYNENGNQVNYAQLSDFVVAPIGSDVFLDVEFKSLVQQAINDGETSVTQTDAEGNEVVYKIERKNEQYTVKADTETQLIQIYQSPSKSHWLGTDGNGMDIMTRLMYGGRISLMIGFIVVIIQTFLGVVLGGIAGYFGKWVDNLIMRIVDIFYCIPSLPLIIILGSIMDSLKVNPQVRIYFLMIIMGLLGWPGVARMVRGQILSLREQEFMTATEAMGISIPRRIFRHLIPNVIPQLIVMATMGLGGIILTESSLSFLGIGVKFPFASWGNIISAVSNVHVMTNYWFVWIPAGFCILLTVLAFNFIGDGLRDAFDPKMKR
ncbi:ABC transporter permease [Lachnoclostridium phytofermentans]|uniref:Binding-protein-dependent transport systems inner membrane component n=1 Tax=Lachnoclostridium phytofermentans (strain ATCC 700394 / DSM 18823 / ISDg) TaxID=357809 RepID=A9KKN0_LACP7|nr:ABC transporter permease [Lachnoclostridium phytofermentans]ABX41201.1 binding-protein-dependent transport systems inner membrane component [Lachnoclostridium phytofermentans ISDg]